MIKCAAFLNMNLQGNMSFTKNFVIATICAMLPLSLNAMFYDPQDESLHSHSEEPMFRSYMSSMLFEIYHTTSGSLEQSTLPCEVEMVYDEDIRIPESFLDYSPESFWDYSLNGLNFVCALLFPSGWKWPL